MALVVHHYSYSNTEEDETHTILAAARALVSSDGWTTLRLQEIEVDDERPVDLHDLEDWVPSQGAFWWNTVESPNAAHDDSLTWEDSGEADTGFMVNEDEEEDESEDEATRSRVLLDFSASHGGEESRDQSGDDPSEEADTAFCLDGDDAIDSDDDSDPDNNLLSSVLSGPNKYGSSALFIGDSVVMSQSSTDEAQALLTRLTPSPDVSPTTAARPFTSDYPASPRSQKRPHVKLSFSADDNDNDEVVEDSLLEEGSSYLPSPTDSQTKELPREDAVPTLPRTPAKVAPSRFKSKSPLKLISALLPVGPVERRRDVEADEESQILDADEFTRLPSPPRKRKKIDTEDGEYEGDPISEWHGCLSNTSHEVEHSPRGEAAPLQPRRDSIRDFVPHPHAHLASEKAIGVRFFETPSVLPPPSDLPPCFYPFPPSPPVSPYTPIGDIGHDYWASKKSLLAPPDDTLGASVVCIFIPIPQDAIPFPPADTDDSVSLIVAFWKELRRMHQELDLSVFVTTRYDATGCPEIPLDDPFWLEEEAQPHLADRMRREAEKDKPKPETEGEEGLQVFCLAPFRFIVKERILASWKSRLDGASRGRLSMKLRGPVEGEDIDEEGWA